MIHLKIKVKIHLNKQKEFEQAVTALISNEGNTSEKFSFDLTRSLDDQLSYLYSEDWENRDSLEDHINTDKFHALLGAMKVLGEIVDSKIIYSTGEEKLAF